MTCPLTGEKDVRRGYFVLHSLTRAFGARTSKELPPLQGTGVPVGLAKRVMPRIIAPRAYQQLMQLVREEGPAATFGKACMSAAVPKELQASAKAFCKDSTACGDGSQALDWSQHTLPDVPFPSQAAVLNTLPSFYETYTKMQPIEAAYLKVVTSSAPGTSAAIGTHAGKMPRFSFLVVLS